MNEPDYQLLHFTSIEELVAAVKNLMAEGYHPTGGVVIDQTSGMVYYLQAMVRPANAAP